MFLHIGFRPFFLFGTFLAAAFVSLWLGFLFGILPQIGFLSPVFWHAHELIFGFGVAIVAGFVLTAIQNWTGIRGVHGKNLGFLVGLWLLGRVVLLAFDKPNLLAMIVNLSFYPVLAFYLFPFFYKDRELTVERVFFLFLALFMTGDALVHLDALKLVPSLGRSGLLLGMNTLIVVIVFMGGRVIPFFTEASVAKSQPKTHKPVEILSIVTAWLFLFLHSFATESLATGVLGAAAGCVHLTRLWGWQVKRIRRVPLLWVLHVSYLWIVIGYFLSFVSTMGWMPSATAIHAFTVGGIGMMIYGMISRVSLGHTGRRLHPSRLTVVGYVLLLLSAIIRVFGVWATGNSFGFASQISAGLWIIAFSFFIWTYLPILIAPRIDRVGTILS